MKEGSVELNDLPLWNIADGIRWFVQRTAFSKIGFMETPNGALLVSSVEGMFLTEGMLVTFLRSEPPSDSFARSLWLWGAIQALVVQQDAVLRLGKALKQQPDSVTALIKGSPVIGNIRELRNRSAGHPVVDDNSRGTNKKFSFPSVHKGKCYSFLMFDENSNPPTLKRQDMDMEDLIAKQQQILSPIIMKWRQELMDEENAFREKNKTPTLTEALSSSTFTYHLSNLDVDSGKLHLNSARELAAILQRLEAEFKRKGAIRGMVAETFKSMKYPTEELIRYFEGNSHLKPQDVSVFSDALSGNFRELTAYVAEIDAAMKEQVK
jgi:hypothetical protein